VSAALDQLSQADYVRLNRFARGRAEGTSYGEAEELVAAALHIAVQAAEGRGGRRWQTDDAFMAYLFNTIRGMASDARRTQRMHPVMGGFFGPEEEQPEVDALPDLVELSVEARYADEEEERLRQTSVIATHAWVLGNIGNDPGMLWIVRAIQEDLPARAILVLSGMSKKQYDAARKRWTRKRGVLLGLATAGGAP
jgi:hypothetical protein